jgi:hypothetical protein
MKANRIALCFVTYGLAFAGVCFARLLYIERTWNDSSFHLSKETSVPAAFLFFSLGVAAVGLVIAIVRCVRQSQRKTDRK